MSINTFQKAGGVGQPARLVIGEGETKDEIQSNGRWIAACKYLDLDKCQ